MRLDLLTIFFFWSHIAGNVAPGEITFAKKYHNEHHSSFSEVCHLFMKEANLNGRVPVACVLACAGPIMNNTVEYVSQLSFSAAVWLGWLLTRDIVL